MLLRKSKERKTTFTVLIENTHTFKWTRAVQTLVQQSLVLQYPWVPIDVNTSSLLKQPSAALLIILLPSLTPRLF